MFTESKEAGAHSIVHNGFVARLEVRRHVFEFLIDICKVLGDKGGDRLIVVAHIVEEYLKVCIIRAEQVLHSLSDIVVVIFLHKALRLAVKHLFRHRKHARLHIK